jgi:hypothetical protein
MCSPQCILLCSQAACTDTPPAAHKGKALTDRGQIGTAWIAAAAAAACCSTQSLPCLLQRLLQGDQCLPWGAGSTLLLLLLLLLLTLPLTQLLLQLLVTWCYAGILLLLLLTHPFPELLLLLPVTWCCAAILLLLLLLLVLSVPCFEAADRVQGQLQVLPELILVSGCTTAAAGAFDDH